MTRDEVVGMFVGVFLGDMLGAPYEFQDEMNADDVVVKTGGVHRMSLGEYTDDGALTLALGESYIANGELNFADVVARFKDWRQHGTYGTRDHCFDVGTTTDNAIGRMKHDRPFAASAGTYDSGNGSLMRIAACIAANHNNPMKALADSIAASLMTHGNSDILAYTTAYIDEIFYGSSPQYSSLKANPNKYANARGTVMYAYNAARHARHFPGLARPEGERIAELAIAVDGVLHGARLLGSRRVSFGLCGRLLLFRCGYRYRCCCSTTSCNIYSLCIVVALSKSCLKTYIYGSCAKSCTGIRNRKAVCVTAVLA
jgi:ADP-ribosylglycohydrolase